MIQRILTDEFIEIHVGNGRVIMSKLNMHVWLRYNVNNFLPIYSMCVYNSYYVNYKAQLDIIRYSKYNDYKY